MESLHSVIYDAAGVKDKKKRLTLIDGIVALRRYVEIVDIEIKAKASGQSI